MSPSVKGSRWRSTSAVTPSPSETSICGMRSGADMEPIISRSGSSRSLTWRGSTWHSRMSATKLLLRSWKPTSTPPFFGTTRTDRRAR
ncbi:hypothetical protein D3C72_1570960 [compost metagenome]